MPLPSQRAVAERDTSSFRILTVCTGNICRSPQAEQLLRLRLWAAFGAEATARLSVASAGTRGLEGRGMDRIALTEAQRLGITDGEQHVARRLLPAMVAEADLVLGLSREHRGAAARLNPSANRRAFSLVEFARIVEALADRSVQVSTTLERERGFAPLMHSIVVAAATARGMVPPPRSQDDFDIVDPYRLEPEVYRASADDVDAAVARIVNAIVVLARPA